MTTDLEYFKNIDELFDIDINKLKLCLKERNISGNPLLIIENYYQQVVLFFEDTKGIGFYSYGELTGLSRKFTAPNLDNAISKAGCLGFFTDALGLQSAKKADCGLLDIDRKKLNIDYPLSAYPKESKKKVQENKMKDNEYVLSLLNEVSKKNDFAKDGSFFFNKTPDGYIVKGWLLDEAYKDFPDVNYLWNKVTSEVPTLRELLTPVDYKYHQLSLKPKIRFHESIQRFKEEEEEEEEVVEDTSSEMDLGKLTLYAVLLRNDLHHIHLHATGKTFDRVHSISNELYDEANEEVDNLAEMAIAEGCAVPSFTNVKSVISDEVWAPQCEEAYDWDSFVPVLDEIGHKYLDAIESCNCSELHRTALDEIALFWDKEINFFNSARQCYNSEDNIEIPEADDEELTTADAMDDATVENDEDYGLQSMSTDMLIYGQDEAPDEVEDMTELYNIESNDDNFVNTEEPAEEEIPENKEGEE